MLGRPAMMEPVFMNMCAVSWLICSLHTDRTRHSSSATLPISGNSSQISMPPLPNRLKPNCGAKHFKRLPLQLRQLLALGERFGHRLPVKFR